MCENIVVTGANGFVGRHFMERLKKHRSQAKLWPCGRSMRQACGNIGWTHLDLLNVDHLNSFIKAVQPSAIVHLAASSSVGYSWQEPRESVLNNLNIYLNILEAVRLYVPRARILAIGSSEVYGQVCAQALPLREDHTLQPASPYAVARASQEALSKVYTDGYGLDIVTTRSFNHFGPGQDSRFALPSFAKQIALAKQNHEKLCRMTVGNIDVVRDFTDVRDVVAAYDMLLDKGVKGEVYNICSSNGRSLRAIIDSMATQVDIEVDLTLSPLLIRPQELPIIIGDHTKITRDVGWQPKISFSTTVSDILAEWISNENLV